MAKAKKTPYTPLGGMAITGQRKPTKPAKPGRIASAARKQRPKPTIVGGAATSAIKPKRTGAKPAPTGGAVSTALSKPNTRAKPKVKAKPSIGGIVASQIPTIGEMRKMAKAKRQHEAVKASDLGKRAQEAAKSLRQRIKAKGRPTEPTKAALKRAKPTPIGGAVASVAKPQKPTSTKAKPSTVKSRVKGMQKGRQWTQLTGPATTGRRKTTRPKQATRRKPRIITQV